MRSQRVVGRRSICVAESDLSSQLNLVPYTNPAQRTEARRRLVSSPALQVGGYLPQREGQGMPRSARSRAAPPLQGQQPLTDRLGLPGKSTGPYPRNSQAEKPGRNQNKSNAASSSESVAGLLSRMNSAPDTAPSQPIASTSRSKASPAPNRAQPSVSRPRQSGCTSFHFRAFQPLTLYFASPRTARRPY